MSSPKLYTPEEIQPQVNRLGWWYQSFELLGGATGGAPQEDHISWWLPNKSCLEEMLTRLAFATVGHVGSHSGLLRPGDHPFDPAISHERKQSR